MPYCLIMGSPATITLTDDGSPVLGGGTNFVTTVTINNVNLGDPRPDRIIVMCLRTQINIHTDPWVPSSVTVTMNGTTMALQVNTGPYAVGQSCVFIYSAKIPTGTSGTFIATSSQGFGGCMAYGAYAIYGCQSATAVSTNSKLSPGSSVNLTLSNPSVNGVFVGILDAASGSWTNGLTQTYSTSVSISGIIVNATGASAQGNNPGTITANSAGRCATASFQ